MIFLTDVFTPVVSLRTNYTLKKTYSIKMHCVAMECVSFLFHKKDTHSNDQSLSLLHTMDIAQRILGVTLPNFQ